MSEMNQEPVGSNNGSWDYLQEQPVEKPIEDKVTDTSKESIPEDESSEDNSKPWQSKKNETPGWARKRFKEYSSTVRELKDQNSQLMETVKQVLGQIKPNGGKLTKEDFPDEDSYLDWKAEQKANEQLSKYDEARTAREKQEQEYRTLQEADKRNVDNALTDMPDYYEAIQNGDPDIRLPANVAKHLSVSPAGPYVKYRIATDDDLSEALKYASPQEKIKIISDLHDSVLDILIKRNATVGEVAPKEQPRTPSVQRKAPPPKAPPQVKGKGTADLLSLSGDDYVKARNEAKRGK